MQVYYKYTCKFVCSYVNSIPAVGSRAVKADDVLSLHSPSRLHVANVP